MTSAAAFQRFAASCTFSTHGYLDIQEEAFVYQQDPNKPSSASLARVTNLALRTFIDNPTKEMKEALKIFRGYLRSKQEGCFASLCCNKERVAQAIGKISEILATTKIHGGSEESVFKLRFLSGLPQGLGVKNAPKTKDVNVNWLNGESTTATVKEWEIIDWLSRQVYNFKKVKNKKSVEERWQAYSKIMIGAYKGDHILIPDDDEHHKTEELIALGAINRTDSHYEKGRAVVGWNKKTGLAKFAGAYYEDIKSLPNTQKHWSLQGDHVSEILFHAVDMRKMKDEDKTLIYSKTAQQVDHLIQAKKLKAKDVNRTRVYHYVAFQFEYAPNSEGIQLLDKNYWLHKVYSSYLYRERIRQGYEDANVGPYGYGKTDKNPRVLE
jgi:hypothetical protein